MNVTRARSWRRRLGTISIVGDIFVTLLCLLAAFFLRFHSPITPYLTEGHIRHLSQYNIHLLLMVMSLVLFLDLMGVYDMSRMLRFRQLAIRIMKAVSYWSIFYMGLCMLLALSPTISRVFVFFSLILTMAALLIWRFALYHWMRRSSASPWFIERVLVVGWSTEINQLYEGLKRSPFPHYHINGCLLPDPKSNENLPDDLEVLGNYERISSLLEQGDFETVLLCDSNLAPEKVGDLSNLCGRHYVNFKVVASQFQVLLSTLEIESIRGVTVLGAHQLPLERPMNRILKRSVDILGGIIGLCLMVLLTPILAILIKRESKGAIFYSQTRIGLNGEPFRIYKFRSMRPDVVPDPKYAVGLPEDDPRVLHIGRFMRSYNLDELPQFWNILLGDMSLVGPRPERPHNVDQLSQYIPFYNIRHCVKPGLTGWAAINGYRGDSCLESRIRYDLDYLEHWNLWFDAYIMVCTLLKPRFQIKEPQKDD